MDMDEDDDFYAPDEPEAPTVQAAPTAAPPTAAKQDAGDELEEGEEEDEGGEMDEDEDSVCFPLIPGTHEPQISNCPPGYRHHHREQRRPQGCPTIVSPLPPAQRSLRTPLTSWQDNRATAR